MMVGRVEWYRYKKTAVEVGGERSSGGGQFADLVVFVAW